MKEDHAHHHHGFPETRRALAGALAVTAAFAIVEGIAGFLANSLALIGDAGHMITDSAALALGLFATWLSGRPPSARHSYGLKRAETMGALLNVLFMLGVIAFLVVEAAGRLASPEPVNGLIVALVAAAGLAVNAGAAWLLHRGAGSLNVRAALLHVTGDLLGSVAALIAGLVILATGWLPIDPILSLFVALLILISSLRLLADVLHVLMEGVPPELDMARIGAAMIHIDGVRSVHDLHVWTIGAGQYALSAHVNIEETEHWDRILPEIRTCLRERFALHHTTLQPETGEAADCEDASCGPAYGEEDSAARRSEA